MFFYSLILPLIMYMFIYGVRKIQRNGMCNLLRSIFLCNADLCMYIVHLYLCISSKVLKRNAAYLYKFIISHVVR